MAPYAEEVAVRGRHRHPGLGKPARVAIVAIVLLAAAGGFAFYRSENRGGCTGQIELNVAVTPELATILARSASKWASTARGGAGECVSVEVTAKAPADVAVEAAHRSNVTLAGLSPTATPSAPSGGETTAPAAAGPTTATSTGIPVGPAPDVWVPDSSAWLVRVRSAAPSLVPLEARSIATSPLVLAVPRPTAALLGWPTQQQTWDTIVGLLSGGATPKVGIVEPNRDAVGLTSLIALGGAAQALGERAGETTVAVTRALIAGRVQTEAELLAQFPKSEADMATALVAAPLSERTLIAYNATAPAVPLAGLYVQPAPPALDYPWAVMPDTTGDRARLAEQLRDAIVADEEYTAELSRVGLRTLDGSATFEPLPGAPVSIVPLPPETAVVNRAVGTWLSLTRPGRMLAVVDVSGSMEIRVPTANNQTRFQVLIEAARQGMALFDDDWQVGLWTFSTNLAPSQDYIEVIPIREMSINRPLLLQAMETLRPKPNGGTGLYDTMLAAYKQVQQGWDPAVVNSVVLMTDGRNDDSNSITLDQLLASLRTVMDARYPINVIAIGFGTEVSRSELEAITNLTGGGTFIASDPADIKEIFLEALSTRPPAA